MAQCPPPPYASADSYMRQSAYTAVIWWASSKICCHVIVTQ